jgi:ADP-heptose:LPS heptosyltransferase
LRRGGYVVVHPGARDAARRWPAAGFAAVARALVADGHRVVLTGTRAEAALTAGIAAGLPRRAVLDLTGRTSLGALAALVDDARLVVTNDTGVSHLAAARRTPSVVVFTASEPERWAPLDRGRHRVVGRGLPNACGAHGPDGEHPCLGEACRLRARRVPAPPGVDEVLAAARAQLRLDLAVPA